MSHFCDTLAQIAPGHSGTKKQRTRAGGPNETFENSKLLQMPEDVHERLWEELKDDKSKQEALALTNPAIYNSTVERSGSISRIVDKRRQEAYEGYQRIRRQWNARFRETLPRNNSFGEIMLNAWKTVRFDKIGYGWQVWMNQEIIQYIVNTTGKSEAELRRLRPEIQGEFSHPTATLTAEIGGHAPAQQDEDPDADLYGQPDSDEDPDADLYGP